MDYAIDILILIAGYVISYVVVSGNKSLNSILIPVPEGEFKLGKSVRFTFIKYSESKQDEGNYLLTLLLFIFLTFLAKVLLLGVQSDGHSWLTFIIGYGILILFQILSIFNIIIPVFFILIYGIPWLIGMLIFDPSFSFASNVRLIGLIAGIIPGIYGGFFFGRNYFLAKSRMKRESIIGETLSGEKLSEFGKIKRKFNYRWMTVAPIFTFLAIVTFFTKSETFITSWLSEMSQVFSVLGIILWILISLNIFVFTVPMIIEMIQQGTWYSAGLFNSEVVAGKENSVKNAYLNDKGEYKVFNFGSTFVIAIIVFAVGFSISGNILDQLINIDFNGLIKNFELVYLSTLLSGFICALNIGVLLSILSHSHTKVRFTVRDIKKPEQLVAKILDADDPVSEFVLKSASPTAVKFIEKYKNNSFMGKTYVSHLLNEIIMDTTVYDADRFVNIDIDADTKKMIAENPVEDDLVLLNRKLLELAYPEELGVFKTEERMKSAKENIALVSKLLQNQDMSVNISSGQGFYVNIKKASESSLDEKLKIPETMRVTEVEIEKEKEPE